MVKQEKHLHRLTSVWIYILLIINTIFGVSYLYYGALSGIILFLNIPFAIMLFKWKKMGYYGIWATAILFFIISVFFEGIPYSNNLSIFVGPVMLHYLIRKQWKMFK